MSDTKKHSASSFSIILGFVCLTLVGLAFIPMLPIKLSPSNELPQITVSYSMSGMTSKVVETEVTSRMESMLGRVSGVKNIYSNSGNGFGRVTIELNKNINKNAARFEVSTIVRQLYPSLPDGVTYPSVQMSRSEGKSARSFLTYTINAPVSSIQMETYAEKHIKPALLQIKGIDKVSIYGASPMIWRLEYDYQQLLQHGLTVHDLQKAIQCYLNK
ncbi:MAG: efflux RND transporter permease subunit, partial [Bacteroidales bacterium]|nr:efflux RND transporter permease subunit [Bacteroidales bacterium]